MIREPFANGDSLIHRIDPRVRILFAAVYACVVALAERFPTLIGALGISFLLIALARLNIREVSKRLAILNGIILFFWVALPLTFKGETLALLGPFTVTWSGVILSAQITLKSNAILSAFIAMVATSSLVTIGHAMNCLRIPEKIIHLLLLTYRYVFVIEQEYQRLERAARNRCFCPGTNMHTYKTYAYMIGMLFVRALDRADRVYQAMLCRGFRGKFYCLSEFSLTYSDIIWSVIMTGIIIGLETLEWSRII